MNVSTLGASLRMVVFALVCLAATGWLVVTIGNVQLGASRVSYEAELTDVSGLLVDDAVEIAGIPVGKVTDITLDRGRAIITFAIDDEVVLPDETSVAISWRNTLGLRNVQLLPAGQGQLEPGHRFPPERTLGPTDLDTLTSRLTPVLQALDPEVANVLVRELGLVLQGREADVQELVDDAAQVLDVVAQRDAAIEAALTDGATLASAFADRRETLQRLLADAGDLGVALTERTDVLLDAVGTLTEAQGELDRLLTANDGTIRELLRDVDRVTAIVGAQSGDLERLLETSGLAIVQYHRISRWGEWFNIRVPHASANGIRLGSERGANIPPRGTRVDDRGNPIEGGGSSSSTASSASSSGPGGPEAARPGSTEAGAAGTTSALDRWFGAGAFPTAGEVD